MFFANSSLDYTDYWDLEFYLGTKLLYKKPPNQNNSLK